MVTENVNFKIINTMLITAFVPIIAEYRSTLILFASGKHMEV